MEMTRLLRKVYDAPSEDWTLEEVYVDALIRVVCDEENYTPSGIINLAGELITEYYIKKQKEKEREA